MRKITDINELYKIFKTRDMRQVFEDGKDVYSLVGDGTMVITIEDIGAEKTYSDDTGEYVTKKYNYYRCTEEFTDWYEITSEESDKLFDPE